MDHAVALRRIDAHTVKEINISPLRVPVGLYVSLFGLLGAGDIREVQMYAGDIGAHGLRISRTWNLIHIVARQGLRMPHYRCRR
jgi:hypothetical protein